MTKKFGATGRFPMGKMDKTDDGELAMGIASDPLNGTVIIRFGTLVSWIGIYPAQARAMAAMLIKHAEALEKKAQ